MLALADEHGVRYTGVIIENYEDDTDGTVKATTDTERFQYFGNMLLHRGGELGYHGYNHQPLSLSDTDYGDVLPYKTWDSVDAMDRAVTELISFGTEMFPGTTMSVYVPPSNVLSEEGRTVLASKYPQIRTIASNFFPESSHMYRNLRWQTTGSWNSHGSFQGASLTAICRWRLSRS